MEMRVTLRGHVAHDLVSRKDFTQILLLQIEQQVPLNS